MHLIWAVGAGQVDGQIAGVFESSGQAKAGKSSVISIRYRGVDITQPSPPSSNDDKSPNAETASPAAGKGEGVFRALQPPRQS